VNFVRNLLVRNALAFGPRPALIEGARTTTHAELDARVNRCANALRRFGVGKGMVISLYARSSTEFAEIFFASHKLGATITAVNTRYKQRELEHQLRHSGASLVLFHKDFVRAIDELRPTLPARHYIAVGGDTPAWAENYEALMQDADAKEPPPVSIGPDDRAAILYTSGTTGISKAVATRYWAGLYLGALETNNDVGLTQHDVTLSAAPLFHQAAHAFNLLMPLSTGGTVVLHDHFDAAAVLESIERHGVTFAFMVPTMIEAVLQAPERASRDVRTFGKLLSSGSALPERTKHGLLAAFPGIAIFENYGATESFNTARLLPSDVLRKQNSAGLPIPTQQVRLVDREGQVVPRGSVGEIVVRGPTVFTGYFNPPAGTEPALDAEGWFRTGDLAREDDEGYLYIVGRAKEMILSGGENIYPREIEEVLKAIPGVADCACIGLPDPYWGEVVCACIVRTGDAPAAQDVIAVCAKELSDYKKPRQVVFLDELPRNAAGKVVRGVLTKVAVERLAWPHASTASAAV